MEAKVVQAFKLAKPDGWDFYTGKTINCRGDSVYPHTVHVPNPNPSLGLCSAGVIHASVNPNDCFVGAKIPCSAYKVEGNPVCGDKRKYGFTSLVILEEITDLDKLFGWRYSEAVKPIHPLRLGKQEPTDIDLLCLLKWASVWDSVVASVSDSVWDSVGASAVASVWASVSDSVWDSVGASAGASVWASVSDSVSDSVWDSVVASVSDSVGASVVAYIGSLFPNIKTWKYTDQKEGLYPYQSCVDLWKRGFVPSFDGKIWRLHSGLRATIVWKG